MKLYYSPGACSMAVHIVLREAGIPFQLAKVDTARHTLADGSDYYPVNRKGQVPVLELAGGARLTEGAVIAQYIADEARRADLMPAAGTLARYRVMEWQNFIASDLHKTYSVLFSPALAAEAKAPFAEALLKKYEWVDANLAAKSPYLAGANFTAADAYLFTVTRWAQFVALDLTRLSNLQAFMHKVAARPSVREAMQAEGLIGADRAA
jgi:glutathione S-transferase